MGGKAREGVVPADIARERQQLLGEQLLAAESALSGYLAIKTVTSPPCKRSLTWSTAAAVPTS